ncbi:MAG TPA: hypothetical protein VFV05_18920 [Methylomirabilota bacterium]|nr:hypothetical protein [Methylomirabilota bacterium]
MATALWLLAIQGAIGAFDTLYYHEWRARLPARPEITRAELRLHAARDVLYAAIFGTLPWLAWHGVWAAALAAILTAEIVLTMADFVVEIDVRRSLGDVYAGERVTHAVMGILYGAALAMLLPALATWWQRPTALHLAPADAPEPLRWLLLVMAAGVFLSGARDLYAAGGLRHGAWPWADRRGA